MSGNLYIVSTPIGNLEDITFRAVNILKNADLIACEDTRTTRKLLNHFSIKNSLTSYHEHNETEKSGEIIKLISQGKNIALVCDAGTPCISDPGYRLVQMASHENIQVIPIPGASAALSALTVSGLPTDNFIFLGFLPRTKKKMIEHLEKIREYPHTIIIYEAARRISKTLEEINRVLGDRSVSLSREITKIHEETLRGSVTEVKKLIDSKESLKGEITLIIEGKKPGTDEKQKHTEIIRQLKILHNKEYKLKEAVSIVTQSGDYAKNTVYDKALEIWNS